MLALLLQELSSGLMTYYILRKAPPPPPRVKIIVLMCYVVGWSGVFILMMSCKENTLFIFGSYSYTGPSPWPSNNVVMHT